MRPEGELAALLFGQIIHTLVDRLVIGQLVLLQVLVQHVAAIGQWLTTVEQLQRPVGILGDVDACLSRWGMALARSDPKLAALECSLLAHGRTHAKPRQCQPKIEMSSFEPSTDVRFVR